MASLVLLAPVPAMIGVRPAECSTATRINSQCFFDIDRLAIHWCDNDDPVGAFLDMRKSMRLRIGADPVAIPASEDDGDNRTGNHGLSGNEGKLSIVPNHFGKARRTQFALPNPSPMTPARAETVRPGRGRSGALEVGQGLDVGDRHGRVDEVKKPPSSSETMRRLKLRRHSLELSFFRPTCVRLTRPRSRWPSS